jgi:hypothetical protein
MKKALALVVVGLVLIALSILVAAYRISVHPGPEMQWPTSLSYTGSATLVIGFTLGFFEWVGKGFRIKVRTAGSHSGPSQYIRGGRPMWVNTEDAERDLPPAA